MLTTAPTLSWRCERLCGRCHGKLFVGHDELVCLLCGWRCYPRVRRLRLSKRDRAQRRVRVRRVAQEAALLGVCIVCLDPAVTKKHCQHHREMNNAAALARQQARRDAGLCRRCNWPALTRDFCQRHRDMERVRQRARYRRRRRDREATFVSPL